MLALRYHAPLNFRVEHAPDPILVGPTDALVRVRLAAICGSDLHVWHGREVGLDPGTVMGHEFVGEVVEVGEQVRRIRVGDRVACPFTSSCGDCFYCRSGLTARCERGELFGWVQEGRGLHGGQAELVRVPLADTTLVALPQELEDQAGLLLGDVLATGFHCATQARIGPGSVCAVLGCGPVGLMAILAARSMGAERVFGIDTIPSRLAAGQRFGAEPVDLGTQDAAGMTRAATSGRGVDAVLEAVGSAEANRLAFELVRPGGTISVVGVHHEAGFPFSPGQAYDKNLTWRIGRCPARAYMDQLVPLAIARQTELTTLFTHTFPLAAGPDAYRVFAARSDGCVKVALQVR